MKRPAFQFYPGDWRSNAKLRRCSEAARGAWIDILCVLHDADEYGICRWPLRDLARAAGVTVRSIQELTRNGVLKGADHGAEPYVYTPRHAGKDGKAITLVAANDGPVWYSTRLVRDEHVRQRRGASTQFTNEKQPPKVQPKLAPNPAFGERQGDGSSSSSSSSIDQEQKLPPSAGTPVPNSQDPIFGIGLDFLKGKGASDRAARSFLGLLRKELNDDLAVAELLTQAERQDVSEPQAWLTAAAKARKQHAQSNRGTGRKLSVVEQVEHAIAERKRREQADREALAGLVG